MRNAILTILIVIIIGAGVLYLISASQPEPQEPIDENPITTPTTTPQAEATYTNATTDLIVVDQPKPGATISRSLTVSGQARGNWFFEASFPIEVVDPNGAILLNTYMEAQGEWMTTEFVPFSRTVTIPGTYTGPATLILRKDNPSGLPEHDASVSMPVTIQ